MGPFRLMSIMKNAIIHKTSVFDRKGAVFRVRLESPLDESLLNRVQKKPRIRPKKKRRIPNVIFKARWCGNSRIAENRKRR